VRELVGAGADVNRKNDKGITPLSVIFPLEIGLSDWSYSGTMQHQSPALMYVVLVLVDVSVYADAYNLLPQIGRFLIERGADVCGFFEGELSSVK
jgi:hypothetical protein